jgi:hypothetical protein
MTTTRLDTPLSLRRVAQTWWPLAAGWILMTIEIPALSAVIARSTEPQVSLAAWGVIFSLALILASPAMMFLGASTTLSRDWATYRQVRLYMALLSLGLTGLHALLAFTPLFDLVVVRWMAAPAEVIAPCRMGLAIMLPYTVALAYRRFNYGVLIRFNHARAVTLGALARLAVDAAAIAVLLLAGVRSGVLIATVTITCGVVGEAVYSHLRVQHVLPDLRRAPAVSLPLTPRTFAAFYLPLVMTSLLQIFVQPLGAAALSRMPNALASLAVWPVVYGLVVLWNSAGVAFTEAVVVLLDETHAVHALHTFAVRMAGLMVGLLLVMNATPLADLWFTYVAALPPNLVSAASWGLWGALLLPGLSFLQSWYTGALMNERHTRAITEAVLLALAANGLALGIGIAWGGLPGIYVGVAGLVAGHLARTGWLWVRTRPALRSLRARARMPRLIPARV